MKISQALSLYTQWGRVKHSTQTVQTYSAYLRKFIQWIGDKEVENVTIEDVIEYAEHLRRRQYYSSTIANKMFALRGFFRFLFAQRIVSLNPFLIPIPRVMRRDKPAMEREEVQCILDSMVVRTFQDLRDKTLIAFLFSSGVRVREVADLLVTDLDFAKSFGYIVTRKSYIKRFIFWDSQTHALLEEYLSQRARIAKSTHVFLSLNRNREYRYRAMSVRAIQRAVRERSEESGLSKPTSPHDYRRGYSMAVLESGVDLGTLSRLLGHKTILSTTPYVRLQKGKLKEIHRAVFK